MEKKNIGKIQIGNTWKKKLPKDILNLLKTKRQLIKEYKTIETKNENSPQLQQQLSLLGTKIYTIRKNIELQLSIFNKEKREKEIKLCTGNSRKAIRQFWSHINQQHSSTIENIKELQNKTTNNITSNKQEIMQITETHILNHFNASYTKTQQIIQKEHIDHKYKRKYNEQEDLENNKKLKSTDFTKSYITDPVGYLDQDFSKEELIELLKEINNGKASGPDTIPNEAYKNLSEKFITILHELYNRTKNEQQSPQN